MASRSGNRLGVIIVAAGRSTRMGGVDKTFATLLGAPLITHTLDQFEAFPRVDEIVLVLAAESVTAGRSWCGGRGTARSRMCVPVGNAGRTRYETGWTSWSRAIG